MSDINPIATIREYAQAWGIPVLERRPSSHVSIGPAMWSIATWATNPRIYPQRCELTTPMAALPLWPYLLHELSHVLCPMSPPTCSELLDTIGIESLSIAHLGLSGTEWEFWHSHTWGPVQAIHDRGATKYPNWLNTPEEERNAYLMFSETRARDAELFDDAGRPTFYIRRLTKKRRKAS